MNRVDVQAKLHRALGKEIRIFVSCALKALQQEKKYVAIYLIDDAAMKRLNRMCRRKNKVTTVLSFEEPHGFPHPEIPKGYIHLGELYLAPSFTVGKGEDIRALALHGLLHLLGYTHQKKRGRIEMEKEETRLFRYVTHHYRH